MRVNSINMQSNAGQNQKSNVNMHLQSFDAHIKEGDLARFYASLDKVLPEEEINMVKLEYAKVSNLIQNLKVEGKDPLIRINPEHEYRPEDLCEVTAEFPSENKKGVSEFCLDSLSLFRKYLTPKAIIKDFVTAIKEAANNLKNDN